MPTAFRTATRLLLLAAITTGCTGGELPGNYFQVNLQASDNDCTASGANRAEQHTYRLIIDSLDLTVAIGEDEWAVGKIDGCRITYESIVVTDLRNDSEGNQHEIRWKIEGEATIDQNGGAACLEEPGLDWIGTETITVIRSQHPAVDPGCTFSFDTTGQFQGLGQEPVDESTDLPPA